MKEPHTHTKSKLQIFFRTDLAKCWIYLFLESTHFTLENTENMLTQFYFIFWQNKKNSPKKNHCADHVQNQLLAIT
jgi:hypothetical protein